MEPITTVTAASSVLSNTLNALKAVRERAQTSKDRDLKEGISALYDNVLLLKEAVMLVTDENNELKAENKQLKLKVIELQQPAKEPSPELRQVGDVNYYFLNDKGPYCQYCFDRDSKLVMLSPRQNWNGGERRHCLICGTYFQEQRGESRTRPMGSRYRGPNIWME
jgi:regulator of replication initiation timing